MVDHENASNAMRRDTCPESVLKVVEAAEADLATSATKKATLPETARIPHLTLDQMTRDPTNDRGKMRAREKKGAEPPKRPERATETNPQLGAQPVLRLKQPLPTSPSQADGLELD